MNFEFSTVPRIIFGPGALRQTPQIASGMGKRALVVVGIAPDLYQPFIDQLSAAGLEQVVYPVAHEPTIELVQTGKEIAQQTGCDLVIGLGGGSAMDASKAIAVLFTNPGETLDYLEVIGGGRPLRQPGLPVIAIPTTAGTGAEVTRNAVLGVPEKRLKVSLRSSGMLPRLAVIDPELTYDLPPAMTASTGLDALTQVIEPYVSIKSNPLTDGLCLQGIERAARSLRRAYEQGHDIAAREDMCLASLFGGLALANARLGAVHGFASPLGGLLQAPHGAVCASLLPWVVAANIKALRERQPQSVALPRYIEIARIMTGDPEATAEAGVTWLTDLCLALHIQPLSAYGLSRREFPRIVEEATRASSMQGNPIKLTPQELTGVLEQAF